MRKHGEDARSTLFHSFQEGRGARGAMGSRNSIPRPQGEVRSKFREFFEAHSTPTGIRKLLYCNGL